MSIAVFYLQEIERPFYCLSWYCKEQFLTGVQKTLCDGPGAALWSFLNTVHYLVTGIWGGICRPDTGKGGVNGGQWTQLSLPYYTCSRCQVWRGELKGGLAQFGREQEGEQNSASLLWGKPGFSQKLETACCLDEPPGGWDNQAQGDWPMNWLNEDSPCVEG